MDENGLQRLLTRGLHGHFAIGELVEVIHVVLVPPLEESMHYENLLGSIKAIYWVHHSSDSDSGL